MRSPVYVGLSAVTHWGILRFDDAIRQTVTGRAGADVKSPLQYSSIFVWLPALFLVPYTVAPRKRPDGESECSMQYRFLATINQACNVFLFYRVGTDKQARQYSCTVR